MTRTTRKRRRRTQRRRRGSEKRAYSDKESPSVRLTHLSISPLSERTVGVPTRCGTMSALPFLARARSAERLRSRRVRWCAPGKGTEHGTSYTRERSSSRRTQRLPETYQRSVGLSTGQSGLSGASSLQPAAGRYSGNADRFSSPSTSTDGEQQLIQESVAQLRHLDPGEAIRSRRCRRCSFCKKAVLRSETLLLAIPFRTVDNPDTRMHRPVARHRSPASSHLAARATR